MNVSVRELTTDEVPMGLIYDADPSREAVADYLLRGTCYGAFADGIPVGEMVLLRTRPFTMEIVNIAVDEKYRCTGVGRALISYAVEVSRKAGCTVLEVGTANAGTGQLAFYQKCGFTITGVDFDFFTRNYTEPIIENGIECRHMIRMNMSI